MPDRELRDWDGPALGEYVTVLTLDANGVELATAYRRIETKLSLPDAFALALAKTGGHTLLAGDAALRALAGTEGVECHGVLWLLDEIANRGLAPIASLHAALTTISQHPRCRLAKAEVCRRLEGWS